MLLSRKTFSKYHLLVLPANNLAFIGLVLPLSGFSIICVWRGSAYCRRSASFRLSHIFGWFFQCPRFLLREYFGRWGFLSLCSPQDWYFFVFVLWAFFSASNLFRRFILLLLEGVNYPVLLLTFFCHSSFKLVTCSERFSFILLTSACISSLKGLSGSFENLAKRFSICVVRSFRAERIFSNVNSSLSLAGPSLESRLFGILAPDKQRCHCYWNCLSIPSSLTWVSNNSWGNWSFSRL